MPLSTRRQGLLKTLLVPAIDATNEALGRFAELTDELGFELIAVLIPSEIHLEPERWQMSLTSVAFDPADHAPSTPIWRQAGSVRSRQIDRG